MAAAFAQLSATLHSADRVASWSSSSKEVASFPAQRCKPPWSQPPRQACRTCAVASSAVEVDVAIVGSGVIGLSIAHELLENTRLSVALVDRAKPCSGASATGAGQGYIWMGHRSPQTPGWDLARHGKELWEDLVERLEAEAHGPHHPLGWKQTGSLLIAANGEEALALQARVVALNKAGVRAEYYTGPQAKKVEPALFLSDHGGAALVPEDSQIDAELAVAKIREKCLARVHESRYTELFHEPVRELTIKNGNVVGLTTRQRTIRAREGVILAAGAWSAQVLMQTSDLREHEVLPLVRPRKGHLLVVEGPGLPSLQHALMECEYCYNYSKPTTPTFPPSYSNHDREPTQTPYDEQAKKTGHSSTPWSPPAASADELASGVAVFMTITTDPAGRLLIGSSREFCGFDSSVADATILAMIRRAAEFVPDLAKVASPSALYERRIRTGLRPYVPDGKPLIGQVPDLPGLLLATGHEGSGLCMALATAELVRCLLTNEAPKVDPVAFLPKGRLVKQA